MKAGVFDGPNIRKLIKDADFVNSMYNLEKRTWYSFVDVEKNYLGNNKVVNYKDLIQRCWNVTMKSMATWVLKSIS